MSGVLLRRATPDEIAVAAARPDPVDAETLAAASEIVDAVRREGEPALRRYAERFGEIGPGAALMLGRDRLEASLTEIPDADRDLLARAGRRIERFARSQRESVRAVEVALPGGRAGQRIDPVERAGCYAPGGRFPLPSSVLMTAITARAAGVDQVFVASPHPAQIILAAAAVAGADGLLCVGGAQAIAALAFGAGPVPACDVVVGPGNRFVTAAKQLVAGRVGIDMLAGPSELTVLADESADPAMIAADLLAQAEHDPDAVPMLVTTSAALVDEVDRALAQRLADLPTAETARTALRNGRAVVAADLDEAIAVCDRLAPEHLELMVVDAGDAARRARHFGALFIGAGAAEVLGDYGAGPNHTLPTGGTALHAGGLSVFDFLRVRTWIAIDDPAAATPLVDDAVRLAELEGLTAHARSAAMRRAR
jgi:phosphoribosyl-ATP pyrophosphohydrolase/phosphoribosyl-AMP cyclohydrolase/histidinol dehydrogenase